MHPNRAPTTSWVQMSAAGTTTLAGSGLRRPAREQQQQQEQTDQAKTSIKSASASSSSTSSSSSAHRHHLQNIQYRHSQPGPPQAPASQATSSTSSGPASLSSCHSGAPPATGSECTAPPRTPTSFSGAPSSQQLQAAMGELQLAEQQLLGLAGADEQQHEENRKLRLQLYVFVLRCISYPFNAKQTATGDHRQQLVKLRKQQFDQIVQLHTRCVRSAGLASSRCQYQHLKLAPTQARQLDELYEQAQVTFNRRFLHNERMRLLVESECCSQQDLRDLFRQNADKILRESALFVGARRQQQQQQHQQQQQQQQQSRSLMVSRQSASSAQGASGDQSLAAEPLGAANQLLANKDAILNTWLIKFESIIREDPAECSSSGAPPAPSVRPAGDTGSAAPGAGPHQAGMSKEQLYQMFQNILNIKKFEHQLLYNALQLDSSDEQAAAIRRELDGRVARIAELERNKKLLPKFVLKEMESLYIEESRMSVNKLMVNLDSLPVMKGTSSESRGVYSGLQKFRRYNSSQMLMGVGANARLAGQNELDKVKLGAKMKSNYPVSSFILKRAQMPLWSLAFNSLSSFGKIAAQASLTRDGLAESHPGEPQLSKLDVVLSFNIEVIVMEVRGLRHLAPNREIYCTMEIEGSDTGRLQTEHVQAKKPLWDTQGDFTTNHPLPVLKIKLYAVNPSVLSLEDKELGKLVLRPTVLSPKTPEWCTMQPSSSAASQEKSSLSGSAAGQGGAGSAAGAGAGASGKDSQQDELKIRVVVRMDRPQQLKHCGFLYGVGKSTWRKFKRRYHILIQVSQYTFVMCAYREKKAKPTEMLQLDGYTVDYIEPPTDLIMEHCSEITSHEHHAAGHASATFGLAGRLAKPFLKQQPGGGGAGGSGGTGAGGGPASGEPDEGAGEPGAGEQPSAIQTAAALSDELHNKYYFNVVKEGDSVVFACDDEQECFGWVMALYRATGQAHKPTPLRSQYASSSSHYIDAAFAYNASASGQQQTKLVGHSGPLTGAGPSGLSISSMLNGVKGKSSVDAADQRARKHGMDEFISADPCKFQHNHLFQFLQHDTLRHRLQDRHCSLGWLSAGQLYVLDEYCARYGVRTCFRHLAYLSSLLDFNQRGYFIDHTLLNYGYDFCASFVSGQSGQANPMSSVSYDLRPDGIGTVTVEERDLFHAVRARLLKMIERQLANFSRCFPFGKPDGALKAALSLLERVLMKEHQTSSMLHNDEVRSLIRKCLEQAALNNYTRLSGQANLLAAPAASADPKEHQAASAAPAPATPASSPTPPHEPNTTNATTSQELGLAGPISDLFGRKRTQSSLSSSSAASSHASSAASGVAGPPASPEPVVGSFRRHQQAATPQQPEQCLTMAMIINNEHVKPNDKLKYLIRLAELCCEQVEEDNEYFSDSFAWHSDLMMEHFELFWSLFSVDMDKVLGELAGGAGQQQQPAGQAHQRQSPPRLPDPRTTRFDSLTNVTGAPQIATRSTLGSLSGPSSGDLLGASNRDAFALFQVLNNHMRKSANFEYVKFKSYLCDTFRPKLLRYIDIMESTLTRMVSKACEKDGQVNCAMVEQMFAKLDELQRFVLHQLRWPDEQLAEQLLQRLKLIAYELCDVSVQRTLQAFQMLERKSNKWTAPATNHASPAEMIQMINLTLDTRNRSLKLCTFNGFDQMLYHAKIDKLVEGALGEMQPGLMAKMLNALDSTLAKLARYDEGNLLAPILSLTYKQGMSSSGRDIGRQYVTFVSNCCDLLRHKINDELWIVTLLEDWYAAQMNTICNWLGERIDHSLHDVQLVALTNIMQKIYADMSLQGVPEEKLNIKTYQTIMSRLKMEEAAALTGGPLFEQCPSSIFNASILSSLTSSGSASSVQAPGPGHAPGASVAGPSPSPVAGQAPVSPGPGAPADRPGLVQAPARQASGQQQAPPAPPARRFGSLNSPTTAGLAPGGADGQQADDGDNIADRALQSATRMFKGFWAN